ncbi:hypothetical protein [Archangium sp.]|uniref:hypothetical protein n=1 Tax=Archangium sp. TaxID=1872627 RepID=UPI002ED80008
MKRMGRVLGMAAFLVLGASGARADNPYISLRTPEGVIVARVSEARIVGPNIRVTRDVKTLRGRAFGQTVFLGLNGNEVGGTVGRNLSRLSFEHEGEVLEAEGAFYGNFTRLSLSARGLSGTVGVCSYELKALGQGVYRGSRTCGGPLERPTPVVLVVPHTLVGQGPAMTLAALMLFLGS